MRVGIVGATGIVGNELLKILAGGSIKIQELRLSASPESVGKRVSTHLGEGAILELDENFFTALDLCFFCATSDISRRWIPGAVLRGAMCIDNSSAFRMEQDVPIIVPEVNGELLQSFPKIVANPNCGVAQLVVALHPISLKYGLEEIVISTYQAVSGAGQRALRQLAAEVGGDHESLSAGRFFGNVIPHIGPCTQHGHCLEELKVIEETRKILSHPSLPMAVTTARVDVLRGHSQSVSFRTLSEAGVGEIRRSLAEAANIQIVDDRDQLKFPQPVMAQHTDKVYVGRIRGNTEHLPRSFSMWIVADNLRKGAAQNALSIAEAWCSLL